MAPNKRKLQEQILKPKKTKATELKGVTLLFCNLL
jgi:hypothetical protein